jgi:hypothetical protein
MDYDKPLPAQLTQTPGTIERHLRILGMLLISLQEQPSRQP